MMIAVNVKSSARTEMIDITGRIQGEIDGAGFKDGLCVLYAPHTTAAVTVNEGADPAVQSDILKELDKIIPLQDGYRHAEGNSAAHIKTSLIGPEQLIIVEDGKLVLGTWQRVFFCEFDGPRNRMLYIKLIG
ncbi:MAG: YjbQ family protein [Deltaproteobacteria bacterium]|nr:YjbQ family protein [Deltaproteobacteria bacterium]